MTEVLLYTNDLVFIQTATKSFSEGANKKNGEITQ